MMSKYTARELNKTVWVNPLQVSGSIHWTKIKEGLRVAVLEHGSMCNQEWDKLKEPIFYTGVVSQIWGNPDSPIVTIVFDDKPNCMSISFGLKEYSGIIITEPVRQERKVRCNEGFTHTKVWFT